MRSVSLVSAFGIRSLQRFSEEDVESGCGSAGRQKASSEIQI